MPQLLSNTQMTEMIFIKILKNSIHKKPRKLLIAFDDIIADVLNNNNNNNKVNPIVTELVVISKGLNIFLFY